MAVFKGTCGHIGQDIAADVKEIHRHCPPGIIPCGLQKHGYQCPVFAGKHCGCGEIVGAVHRGLVTGCYLDGGGIKPACPSIMLIFVRRQIVSLRRGWNGVFLINPPLAQWATVVTPLWGGLNAPQQKDPNIG